MVEADIREPIEQSVEAISAIAQTKHVPLDVHMPNVEVLVRIDTRRISRVVRNLLANAMVSFSCAMQVQAFRKVNGYAFASTMCIGNIRSGTDALCAYFRTKDRNTLFKSLCYWAIILLFGIGAAVGGHFIRIFDMRTIWFSCCLLFVSFLFMFIKEERE